MAIERDLRKLHETTNKDSRSNLNHRESVALDNLKHRKNIIIKMADKGGKVVILDKEIYRNLAMDILTEDKYI